MVPTVGLKLRPRHYEERVLLNFIVKFCDKKTTYMIHNQLLTSKYYSHIIHIMINEGVLICRIVVPFIPVVQPQTKR